MSIQIDKVDLNRQLARFDRSVRKFIHNVEVDSNKAVRKIALDLWKEVKTDTPRETGRAMLGWGLDVTVTNWKPPPGQASYPAPAMPNPPESDVLYLFNNVEYIVPLEFGHSQQAPAGMLRPALIKQGGKLQQELKQMFGRYWRLS